MHYYYITGHSNIKGKKEIKIAIKDSPHRKEKLNFLDGQYAYLPAEPQAPVKITKKPLSKDSPQTEKDKEKQLCVFNASKEQMMNTCLLEYFLSGHPSMMNIKGTSKAFQLPFNRGYYAHIKENKGYILYIYIYIGQVSQFIIKGEILEKKQILVWILQILGALNYAHDNNINHGQLRLQHVFIDFQNRAKLRGFKFSLLEIEGVNCREVKIATGFDFIYPLPFLPLKALAEKDLVEDIRGIGKIWFSMCSSKPIFDGLEDIGNNYGIEWKELLNSLMFIQVENPIPMFQVSGM